MLRGLAAGSAFAIAQSFSRAVPALAHQLTASPFQRLNVIVHGLSVIEFGPDQVNMYLPSAPPDYAYLAGSWMQETALSRGGEYRLSGVMTGSRPQLSAIDPEKNAVFAATAKDQSLSFCRFVLPFPDYFVPLRLIRKQHGRKFFTGSPQPIIEPSAIPQVVVLSYEHPDPTSMLEFRPLVWTPVIVGGVVNFHVWDAPAKPPTAQEAQDGFAQIMKMIGSPAIKLNAAYEEIKPPPPDENPSVFGLSCQGEWTLVERLGEPDSCGKHGKKESKKAPFEGLPLILY